MLERDQEMMKDCTLVEYNQDFKEIKISGDYAFEWGCYSGEYISGTDKHRIRGSGKLMRILKLDKDGTWKVFRAIWTVDPC